MKKNSLASIGLVLVILAAGAWLYTKLRPDRIETQPYKLLGRGAAEATAKLLNGAGTVVLVNAEFGNYKLLAPTTESAIDGFRSASRKLNLKVAAVDQAAIVPPSLARDGIFMKPGQIADLVARHATADALVLFVGLANAAEVAGLPQRDKPKLVLVSNVEPNHKSLLQSGHIHLAIAPRPNTGNDAETSTSATDWFDRHYQAITREQLEK